MAGGIVIERRDSTAAPALAIGGRFKGFRPEEERSSSSAEVKESVALRQLKAAWRACRYDATESHQTNYNPILETVAALQYKAEDVEGFSIALAEFQEEEGFSSKAGLFLSALMNSGKDTEYIIRTRHLVVLPDLIGFRNEKSITIQGDAGKRIGTLMRSGSIAIKGDVNHSVGNEMEGGAITVEGDAGGHAGTFMLSGSISVHGSAGRQLGSGMRGGSITVKKDAGEAIGFSMQGGSITIDGDAGENVGLGMKGGSITVNGNVGDGVGRNMGYGTIAVMGDAGRDVGGTLEFWEGGGFSGMHMFTGGEIRINGETEGISQWLTFDGLVEHKHAGRIYHKGELVFGK